MFAAFQGSLMHRSLPPQLRGKGPGLLVLHTVEGLGFSIGVPFESITLHPFLCFTNPRISGLEAQVFLQAEARQELP